MFKGWLISTMEQETHPTQNHHHFTSIRPKDCIIFKKKQRKIQYLERNLIWMKYTNKSMINSHGINMIHLQNNHEEGQRDIWEIENKHYINFTITNDYKSYQHNMINEKTLIIQRKKRMQQTIITFIFGYTKQFTLNPCENICYIIAKYYEEIQWIELAHTQDLTIKPEALPADIDIMMDFDYTDPDQIANMKNFQTKFRNNGNLIDHPWMFDTNGKQINIYK